LTDQANIKAHTADDASLLFQDIADVIKQARQQVRQAVNTAMVQSYWQIGHLIVEHEQQGQQRAAYGKQQLQQLSKLLTLEFGKGFDASNLRNMRSFYLCFPKCDAVSHKLSWTHYRKLIRVEKPKARAEIAFAHALGYYSPNNTPHAYQRCAPRGVTFFLAGKP